HHGLGDRDAFGDQSPGRRAAGADSDGRWRHRRAVRRARRTEDERRAAAPDARSVGACGRHPVCARPRGAAGDSALRPSAGYRHMRRRTPMALLAALGALAAPAGPAAAERLVASLSNHRVMVTSSFAGEELVLFGGIEQDPASRPRRGGYDIILTVTRPRPTTVHVRKAPGL